MCVRAHTGTCVVVKHNLLAAVAANPLPTSLHYTLHDKMISGRNESIHLTLLASVDFSHAHTLKIPHHFVILSPLSKLKRGYRSYRPKGRPPLAPSKPSTVATVCHPTDAPASTSPTANDSLFQLPVGNRVGRGGGSNATHRVPVREGLNLLGFTFLVFPPFSILMIVFCPIVLLKVPWMSGICLL